MSGAKKNDALCFYALLAVRLAQRADSRTA